jgi:hypothetical protein
MTSARQIVPDVLLGAASGQRPEEERSVMKAMMKLKSCPTSLRCLKTFIKVFAIPSGAHSDFATQEA